MPAMRILISLTALTLLIASVACSSERPENYAYDQNAHVPPPDTATASHKAYADCMLRSQGIKNHGYQAKENIMMWYMQRCRFLEPPALGITTSKDVQECIYEYGPWLASSYKIKSFPEGRYGSRALTVVEAICAPSSTAVQVDK